MHSWLNRRLLDDNKDITPVVTCQVNTKRMFRDHYTLEINHIKTTQIISIYCDFYQQCEQSN